MVRCSAVTILGGGLSGLSAAFHLSRRFPAQTGVRITLVEKAQRLGGWVQSERVRVKCDQGHQADVLLESGPRTLRPASKAILELIHLLNLSSSVLTVSRNAPAARNRFLHIPGTKGLVTIPGSLPSLLVSPLAKILVPAIVADLRRRDGTVLNTSDSNDESVDAFLTRHFGSEFAQTFGSALVHGIYAADSRRLSVRAAFLAMCRLEEAGGGSVVRGALAEMLSSLKTRKAENANPVEEAMPYELGAIAQLMKGVSVYSFRDGMQTLTDAMVRHLEHQTNVTIIKGDGASSLAKIEGDSGFQVSTESGMDITSSHIVSALPLPLLHELLSRSPDVLRQRPAVKPSSTPMRVVANHRKLPPFPHPALSTSTGTIGRYQVPELPIGGQPNKVSSCTNTAGSVVPLPSLPRPLDNPSSSVVVVNLVFPPSENSIHREGFGYLIPRPRPDYPSPGSSLGMLGTVFDSSALGGQDISCSADQRPPKFTKVTVMLGGPYGPPSPDPQSPRFLPELLTALQQHLGHGHPLPEPCLVRIRQHRDCIPTPTVGHLARIAELRAAVRDRWGDSAAIIGAAAGGVSVGDCIESGRRVALEM
ncbi:Protoporphyrinogen oxidase [Cubamyces sp. BRFM 1775]|nr:Protoporphyrinogen oxidase [Cubamyces sp. BRFM 1775]